MTRESSPRQLVNLLFVTGLSGAGKSTALDVLEDLNYEVIDNLPLRLLDSLLRGEDRVRGDERSIAVGIDSRTRAFNAHAVIKTAHDLRRAGLAQTRILFLNCNDDELARRFSKTRRRHPLALDRPILDGIAIERTLMNELYNRADIIIDSGGQSIHDLRTTLTTRLSPQNPKGQAQKEMTLVLTSFGFGRGLPRAADLVFDMRFLVNPYWQEDLRARTGRDPAVVSYIQSDPAYRPVTDHVYSLLDMLLPAYVREGKAYLTIAFGCTGGRHRSVCVTQDMAQRLHGKGFHPMIVHRDIEYMETAPMEIES